MNFPIFTTHRLVLTPISSADAQSIFELFSNPDVVRYYDCECFDNLSQAQSLIRLFKSRYETLSGIRWAIRLTDAPGLIGTCGFNSWNQAMHWSESFKSG